MLLVKSKKDLKTRFTLKSILIFHGLFGQLLFPSLSLSHSPMNVTYEREREREREREKERL
jgi:hypothetical protein